MLYDQNGALRTFKTSPTGLLDRIRVRGLSRSRVTTVTFNGDIGARQLYFELLPEPAAGTTNTVNLNGTGTNDVFYDMDVETESNGWGILNFTSTTSGQNPAANLRGNIGIVGATAAANRKLKSLNINRGADNGARTVRILGNIHTADPIALNGNTLVLGNDTGTTRVFGNRTSTSTSTSTSYTVSAPIATTSDGSGILRIRDFDYTFQGAIGPPNGATARKLNTVRIENARATFGADINATTVNVESTGTLEAAANINATNVNVNGGGTLQLGGAITISSSSTTGGLNLNGNNATLSLGGHKLTANRPVTFSTPGATSGQEHVLSLTLDGSGGASDVQLNATNGLTLPQAGRLKIVVNSTADQLSSIVGTKAFNIISSNVDIIAGRFPGASDVSFADPSLNAKFPLSVQRPPTAADGSQDLKTVVLQVTNLGRQVIANAGADLNAAGSTSGVTFTGNGTLRIPASTFTSIGQTGGFSASANGGNTPRGSINFLKSITVAGRIGGDNTNLLDTLTLSKAAGATIETAVTFNGAVGARQLVFASDATANLNASGVVHRMNVVPNTDGEGTLRLGHQIDTFATLRGNIGTSTKRLKSLTINSATVVNARNVSILGNIYANNIALNKQFLRLGTTGTADLTTPYTVDGPVTNNGTGLSNSLIVTSSNYHLKGQIAASANRLSRMVISEAIAKFDRDVYSEITIISAGSTVVVNPIDEAQNKNLTFSSSMSAGNGVLLCNNTESTRSRCEGQGATGGVTLDLGANTLTVANATVVFAEGTGTGTGTDNPRRHKLSVTVSKTGSNCTSGSCTSGQLNASSRGLTLSDNLLIDVQVAPGSAAIATGDTFTVATSNATALSVPSGVTAQSSDPSLTFAVTSAGTGTANRRLVITATRLTPQVIPAGPAGTLVPLDTDGKSAGVRFEADRTLSVAAGENIGRVGDISVRTNASAARGTITFAGASTVQGQVGGELSTGTGVNTVFNTRPTNLLKTLRLSGAAASTVTFNGGVGAQTLHFSADGTAALNAPATGRGEHYHKMNVTTATTGQGTLSFGNATGIASAANFWGDIGEPATGSTAAKKLKSLSIAAASGTRTVRMLGDIYADEINLNGNNLNLGNDSRLVTTVTDSGFDFTSVDVQIFGARPTTNPRTYRISAPIKTTSAGSGELSIRDFDHRFDSVIGTPPVSTTTPATPAVNLGIMYIRYARASFGADIYTNGVNLTSATLALSADVKLSGGIVLGNTERGGSTLALGAHTLETGNGGAGVVNFGAPQSGNLSTLSLTLDLGANATATATGGRLYAHGNVVAPAGTTIDKVMAIHVTIANPRSIASGGSKTLTILSSNTALPAELNNITPTGTPGFTYAVARNTANNRELVLTATRTASPLIINDASVARTPNDANGVRDGVKFEATSNDRTLTTNSGFANIGDIDGVSVTTNGGADPRGKIDFGATGTVSGRIGGDNTNLLDTLTLSKAAAATSETTVTFNGAVGARQLVFASDATANLNASNVVHRMTVVTNTTGEGALSFGHSTGSSNAVSFRGNIGTSSRRLKSLTIPSHPDFRTLQVLGDIYANSININNQILLLGPDGSLSGASDLTTRYTVDGPVTGGSSGSGFLTINRSNFHLKGQIGTSANPLRRFLTNKAIAKFDQDIYANIIAALGGSKLVVNPTGSSKNLTFSPGGERNVVLCNNTKTTSTTCAGDPATGGVTLDLGANTLTVANSGVVFVEGTGTGTGTDNPRRHKLSVTVSKTGSCSTSGNCTSGQLNASAGGLTLSANLLIELKLATGSQPLATGDTFTIATSNTTLAVPSGVTVNPPAGFDSSLRLTVTSEGSGTENRRLVLNVNRPARQVLDTGTTPAGNVPLDTDGVARGVEFKAERTLSVGEADKNTIGNVDGIAVINSSATAAQGTINFNVPATVSGRIGGALNTGAAFNPAPRGLLNRLDLAITRTTGFGGTVASPLVTFNGGVGAQRLHFAQDNTAALNGPQTGTGDIFHSINVTTATDGQGMLRFGNAATKPANLRGNIGEPAVPAVGETAAKAAKKLKSLTLQPLTSGSRTVRVLGDLYISDATGNGIALNGNTLVLGTRSIFGAGRGTAYTVDAPITTSGTLTIKDHDFNLTKLIGGTGTNKLTKVSIANAKASFSANINATDVELTPGSGQRPELVVGTNNLTLSDNLTLGSDTGNNPATLTLGANRLKVNGTVTFKPASAANPHKLALTLDTDATKTFGQLDADSGSVVLPADLSHLQIDVSLAAGTTRVDPALTAILSGTDLVPAASVNSIENIKLGGVCAERYRCTLALGGPSGQPRRHLSIAVVPVQPQIVTANVPLNASGEADGIEFRRDVTLTVPAGPPTKRIGNASVSVSIATQTDNQGTVAFAGAGIVPARIGSLLTSGSGSTIAFLDESSPLKRVKAIRIDSANIVTFDGGIGAYTLNFSADGTAALKGPTTSGADLFHKINVTGSGASGGRGTLRFDNTRAANVLGNIGTTDAKLKSLSLVSGSSKGEVRLLGGIEAAGIALNGRTLTLGNGATDIFATSNRATTYEVNAPITTNSDGSGALNIKDFKFNLKGPIGTPAAKLATLNLRNATAMFDEPINVSAVALHDGSTLSISKALTLAGTLALNNPSHGSTLALGAHALTLSGALSFNGTATHKLALTLGGATNGRVSAPSVTQGAGASLRIDVDVANTPTISDAQVFPILSSTADLPASLANATVNENNPNWDFDLSLSANNKTLRLTAKPARVVSASVPVAADDRGDLALVPYYTVRDAWVTGIHIVNTSDRTQVVKVRLRRATDALNALDFNLVLSPKDVYAGFLSDNENGVISWSSSDATCTVPETQANRLEMPTIYRAGADTGYVEVIAMGAPSDERQPIALAARHGATGKPLDCEAVRSNFFADGTGTAAGATTRKGVENNATTWQAASSAGAIRTGGRSTYEKSGNALKVSYFIRDNATGIEFGDNAVHIRNFLGQPAITNQQYSVLAGDLNGFDFPDLNGGVPLEKAGTDVNSVKRGRFDALRASNALGVESIVNEWSVNRANGVQMDWCSPCRASTSCSGCRSILRPCRPQTAAGRRRSITRAASCSTATARATPCGDERGAKSR